MEVLLRCQRSTADVSSDNKGWTPVQVKYLTPSELTRLLTIRSSCERLKLHQVGHPLWRSHLQLV